MKLIRLLHGGNDERLNRSFNSLDTSHFNQPVEEVKKRAPELYNTYLHKWDFSLMINLVSPYPVYRRRMY